MGPSHTPSTLLTPPTDVPFPTLPAQVPHFNDEPRWTRLEAGMDPGLVWPAVMCPEWELQTEMSCEER